MDKNEIHNLFLSLYDDVNKEDEFSKKKPLLAHYTSFDSLEKILRSEEIWLSNPLFMNDIEEVVFGFTNAAQIFRDSQIIRDALVTPERFEKFLYYYDYYVNKFEEEGLLDTYAFCFSEHKQQDENGLLSMWRGYGANGRGAAVVFDTSKLSPKEGTTLTLAKVQYLSSDERRSWISEKADQFATLIDSITISDDEIYVASHALYDRIKIFSLFSKHEGFSEEKEWRVVYLTGRGSDDDLPIEKHYLTTARGIEPKLRLKVKPIDEITNPSFTFEEFVSSIILGPGAQSALAVPAFQRMLELINKPELKDKVIVSSIPYRPV